ncbi:S-layer homology domain-containing protein [Paenibacillus sp. MMS18-CY102]|uniref:S-layer homology domain-containing protein n=1 Tax=Paenibacillus sp. MMS18-CY102 TaxID=2682849 RepID=UPI001365CDD6|nr:S-layer homology domain-containing protein [Paenibacillus sp. MMS18-CY102]MWC30023.1 hypothetical protein [Paenibacillus sp. MMS18-CY102]
MARLKKWLAGVMAVMLLIGLLPAYVAEAAAGGGGAAASDYVRIRNHWQNNYLYESSDGVVRYGFTASTDQSSQWLITEENGNKRIQNRKTGHYITLADVTKRRDALTAREITVSTTADQWLIEAASNPNNVLIKSATVASSANLAVHVEDQLGFAEVSSDINVSFDSPQWRLEPVKELQPVRIINEERAGQALYAKANAEAPARPDDQIAFGKVDASDTSSQWYLEPGSNGNYRLLNVATGHYVTQFDGGDYWRPIEMGTTSDPLKQEWSMQPALNLQDQPVPGFVTFASAFNGNYVLNSQFPGDTFARSNDWSNAKLANAHWRVVPVYDVRPVRIVNFTTGNVGTDYLYEEGGVVKHGALGAANADNARYQWIVEDYDGAKRIRNAETGNYVQAGNPLTLAPDAGNGAAGDQWAIQASTQYDDYVTIKSKAGADTYLNVAAGVDTALSDVVDPLSNGAQWLLEDPTVPTDGSPQYVRIQNEWQPFVFYEDDNGDLKYGNARTDQRDQWVIEKFSGRKRIKNRATGHYINMQSMQDGHLRVTDVQDSWTSAVWIIETVSGGARLIHSVNDPSSGGETDRLINLQNLTKYAEYSVMNRNWGSPRWRFINVVDNRPTNVKLINKKTGEALYEEVSVSDPTEGTVKYGDAATADPTSTWFVEDAGDGSIRLKNLTTGHYIAMQNVGDTDVNLDSPPQALQALGTIYPTWGSAKWLMDTTQDAGYVALRSAWAAHFVKTEDADGAVKVSKAVNQNGTFDSSGQFKLEPVAAAAPQVPAGYVRIRNVFNQQYLYENQGGVVLYGNAEASNGYSHWKVVTNNGVSQLENRVTGHVMAISGDYRYIQSVPSTGVGSNPAASQWAIEASADGASMLIRSLDGAYNDEYINVQNSAGYAERGLYPVAFGSLQWQFSEAPDAFETPQGVAPRNEVTATPAQAERNEVRIAVQADGAQAPKYLAEANGSVSLSGDSSSSNAIWLAYDFNGRKLLKNKATGHLLAQGSGEALTGAAASQATDVAAQWTFDDKAGYRTIRSGTAAQSLLAHSNGAVSLAASDASDDILWSFQPVVSDVAYEAENAFVGSGAKVSKAEKGFTGEGYVDGFTVIGAKASFAVNAQAAGSYEAVVRYNNQGSATRALNVYVNGERTQTLQLAVSNGWADASLNVALRAGINSVSLQQDSGDTGNVLLLDNLTVKGSIAPDYRGATVPYITYEAEHGTTTNGTVLEPSRAYHEVAAEASGRQAVRLDQTDEYVSFKAAKAANSIVVRFSTPDSADGSGQSATLGLYVNGQFRQKLEMNSKHAWEYGSYPWSNDPNQGSAHRFFDEMHALVGDIPAGATVTLKKDADSTADYYIVDLAELEQVAAPLVKPSDFLSVTDYGAVASDGNDDTAAFQAALEAAKQQHKGIWAPQGEFELRGDQIVLNDVTIRGAGMWYTQLTGARFMGKGNNIQVYDLLVDGDINIRDDEAHTHAFEGAFGPGSVIQNVWIEHSKTGLWLTKLKTSDDYTDGLYMLGLRIRNLMADGINFCVGTSNSMMEQSDIRYPGDDGIAMWSAEGRASINNTARFNTVALPWLADNIVVFGGQDNKIQDNIAKDTITNGAGIAVSTRFNPVPFSGTTIVERNTLIRTGSYDTGYVTDLGAIWVFAGEKDLDGNVIIRNNVALDSTYQGLSVQGAYKMNNVLIQDLVIDGTGTKGVAVSSAVKGGLVADNIIVRNARIADVTNSSSNFELREQNEGFANVMKPFSAKASDGTAGRFVVQAGSTLAMIVLGAAGADVTADASFSVGDASVASIQPSGVLTGRAAGETTVEVTVQGNKRTYSLLVLPSDSQPSSGGGGVIGGIGGNGNATAANDSKLLASNDSQIVFTIDDAAAANGDGTVVFSVDAILKAAADHPNAAIVIQNGTATYQLPLSVAKQLLAGTSIADKDGATVTLSIDSLGNASASKLEKDAKRQGLHVVGTPIVFGVTLQADGQQQSVNSLGRHFVTRTIEVDGVLDAKSATVLVYDEAKGTFKYVPATFATAGGKTTVTIRGASNGVYVVATNVVSFDDLTNHWAKALIEKLASKWIVNGVSDSMFAPNRSVTRAEFAALLVRALGLQVGEGGSKSSFSDVVGTAWYAGDVSIAAQFELIQGFADGSFHPGDSITREQMAVMIARAYELVAGKATAAGSAPTFSDSGSIHGWASDAVALAIEAGIMQGKSEGQFAPSHLATRAEAAVVIGRMLQALHLMD